MNELLGRDAVYEDEENVSITYARVRAAYRKAEGDDISDESKDAVVIACALDVASNKRAISEKEANDLFAEDGSRELTSVALVWACVSIALDNV